MSKRRRIFFLFLNFICLIFASGCAIRVPMHPSRFEIPESEGKGQVSGYVGLESSRGAVVVQNWDWPSPNTQKPEFETDPGTEIKLGGAVGLPFLERLNLEMRSFPSKTNVISLKYQLLGRPRSEARFGNFSLSTSLGGFYATDRSTHNSNVTGLSEAKYDVSLFTVDLGVSAGFRLADSLLLYTTGAVTRYAYSGTITHKTTSGTTTAYELDGRITQLSLLGGVHFDVNPNFFLRLETGIAPAVLNQGVTLSDNQYVLGGVVGLSFSNGSQDEKEDEEKPKTE